MGWKELEKDLIKQGRLVEYPTGEAAAAAHAQIILEPHFAEKYERKVHAFHRGPRVGRPWFHYIVLDPTHKMSSLERSLAHELSHEELHSSPDWEDDATTREYREFQAILRAKRRFGKWGKRDLKNFRDYLRRVPANRRRGLVATTIRSIGYDGKIPWLLGLDRFYLHSSVILDPEKFERELEKRGFEVTKVGYRRKLDSRL